MSREADFTTPLASLVQSLGESLLEAWRDGLRGIIGMIAMHSDKLNQWSFFWACRHKFVYGGFDEGRNR